MNIQFLRTEELLEYYLILYKAYLPLTSRNNLKTIMEHNNPFNLQYGFMPTSPLPLLDKMGSMFNEWGRTWLLDQLHVKALFCRNNIPAIKEGRLIEIDFGLGYYRDIYSLNVQLDYIVHALLAVPKSQIIIPSIKKLPQSHKMANRSSFFF
ncbi:hypothetical protein [Paenibacillus odorifer]|uniref:Uncharacterized protein n=1 Tax=Paenibacillus odorifer TaxID=189426 RepID=A0A1R0XZM4_9BACL|nr:hypothetical protein [Paenibacillus odorifer]OMD40447.1 hypothetical protein BSK52_13805 [Paenibacillus odorifer]